MRWTALTPYSGWEFNTKAFPRRLSFSTNIKEIHVDFTMQYSHNLPIERFDDVGRVWLRRLKCVQKLSLALLAPKGDPASFVRRAVDVANSNLGIQGKKEVRTRTRYVVPGCVDIEWTWEAKEGEALAWTVCQTERRCLAGKMMLQTGRR
jgi:hypothetical protein